MHEKYRNCKSNNGTVEATQRQHRNVTASMIKVKICKKIWSLRRVTRNFRGQGPNPWKRAHQTFLKEEMSCECCFQIHKKRKYYGRFNDVIALKINHSYCYFSSRQGEEKGAKGNAPRKFSESRLSILGKRPFWYREDTKKGTFVHLLKNAGV